MPARGTYNTILYKLAMRASFVALQAIIFNGPVWALEAVLAEVRF